MQLQQPPVVGGRRQLYPERVVIKQNLLKSSIAILSAAWDVIKDLPDNALLEQRKGILQNSI